MVTTLLIPLLGERVSYGIGEVGNKKHEKLVASLRKKDFSPEKGKVVQG